MLGCSGVWRSKFSSCSTCRPLALPIHLPPLLFCRSTLSGVINIAGMLFASTLFVGFTNCMTIQSPVEVQR